jgi:hypothetical protein
MPLKYVAPEKQNGVLDKIVLFMVLRHKQWYGQEFAIPETIMQDENALFSEIRDWAKVGGAWNAITGEICNCKSVSGHFASCAIVKVKQEKNVAEIL